MKFLLLRGLSREQRHWGEFPRVLEAHVPGSRVFMLDLPGAGTEYRRDSPTTIREIVEDLRGRWLLQKLADREPWCLFGISLGGMVAMQWCADHPSDFERLVLCNTSAANLSRPWKRFDSHALAPLARSLIEQDPVERERLILSVTTHLQTDLGPIAARWASYHHENPMNRANILKQLFAAARFMAPEHLEVPAIIMAGGRDGMTDPSCPRKLANRFRIPLETHPGAGHELALDAPEWLAERVAAWLSLPAPAIAASA